MDVMDKKRMELAISVVKGAVVDAPEEEREIYYEAKKMYEKEAQEMSDVQKVALIVTAFELLMEMD